MTFSGYTQKEMDKALVMKELLDGLIDIKEAQRKLGVSERTIYRYKKAIKEEGVKGLIHGLRGKPSNNKIYKLDKLKPFALKKKYEGFGPTLLAEELEKELGRGKINSESLRLAMIRRGIRVPKKRKVRRQKRDRRKQEGELIQFDGSYHDWLEDGVERCVLLAIDDATGKIKEMKFAKGETIEDITEFWKEYMEENGKPNAIYVDRHATYKVNNGNKDMWDQEKLTRFSRAMGKLGILVIYANSPEGKGRVERSFRTHQDRLIKKMRLNGIKTENEANEYIKETYIPEHNEKYSVKAKEEGDQHIPLSQKEKERFYWYFAKESKRKIKRDGTVRYNNKIYQIKKGEKLYDGYKLTILENIFGDVEIYSGKSKLTITKIFDYHVAA